MAATFSVIGLAVVTLGSGERMNEVWTRAQEDANGIVREFIVNPLPQVSLLVRQSCQTDHEYVGWS